MSFGCFLPMRLSRPLEPSAARLMAALRGQLLIQLESTWLAVPLRGREDAMKMGGGSSQLGIFGWA